MNNINKIAMIVTKILEIGHWVCVILMIAVAVCAGAAPQYLNHLISMENNTELSAYGLEITVINSAGELNEKALILFAVGSVFVFSLMAMVFRNLYLIIKKSANSTPFQKDNIRMLREIGIFSVSLPIVGLIMSIIVRLVIGAEAPEMSVNFDGFIMGIIVFCLTQFFAHGAELEKDVDGLL